MGRIKGFLRSIDSAKLAQFGTTFHRIGTLNCCKLNTNLPLEVFSMNSTQSIEEMKEQSSLLKKAFRGNALFSGLSGLVAVLGARPLARFSGIEMPAVFIALGIILIIYGIDLWWISSREPIDHRFAWAAIILDILWVVGSVAVLLIGLPELTVGARWAVFFLAEIVAFFAILQFIGLRRAKSG